MRRVLVCLGLTVLGFSMLAAYPRSTAMNADDPKPAVQGGKSAAKADERPVVFLFHSGAMKNGAEKNGAEAGLVCAVWPDGAVLSARNWSEPGVNLQVGKLKGPVADLIKQLEADGLATGPELSVGVPDASSFRLGFDLPGHRTQCAWDERVLPSYGRNAKPDDAYRAFAAAWIKTKITLAGMPIDDRRDLTAGEIDAGSFRGYKIEKPWTTDWLRTAAPAKKK